MEELVKYSTLCENLNDVYNNVKQYLFDIAAQQQQYDNTVIDVLRNIKKMSQDFDLENKNTIINPFKNALEDFFANNRQIFNGLRCKPKRNIYVKDDSANDNWIWPSKNWCEIQIENYTDHNGLCNIYFILSTPNDSQNELYNIYIDDILYKKSVKSDIKINVNIPFEKFGSRILKIEKINTASYYVQNDERKLYFCIKKIETDFMKFDGIKFLYEDGFYGDSVDWKWSGSTIATFGIYNCSCMVKECSFNMLVDSFGEGYYNIYADNNLLIEKSQNGKTINGKFILDKLEYKQIRIEKLDAEYNLLDNDDRKLFFCVKEITISSKDVCGKELLFGKEFYSGENEWHWASDAKACIIVNNYDRESNIFSLDIKLDVLNPYENSEFEISDDDGVLLCGIKKNMLVNIKFYMTPVSSKKIYITKLTRTYSMAENDNRELFFCVRDCNFNTEDNKRLIIEYGSSFYGVEKNDEHKWNWSSKSVGEIEVNNLSPDDGIAKLKFKLNTLCNEEDAYFNVYVGNDVITEKISPMDEVCLNIPINGKQDKHIAIEAYNVRKTSISSDDRVLTFFVYDLNVEFEILKNNNKEQMSSPANEKCNKLRKRVLWRDLKSDKHGYVGGIDKYECYCADINEIKSQIDMHDIICFDIFDTLLCRETLYPEDVFDILESRALELGYNIHGLASERKQAQSQFEYMTIEQIYKVIGEKYSLSENEEKELAELEIAVESDVLQPRVDVLDIYNYALYSGKTVYIVSDMYLPSSELEDILLNKGITRYKELLVSCDYKMTKREGLLLKVVEKENSHNIIHIGNDLDNDIYPAYNAGIDAYYLMSGIDLYVESPDRGELLGKLNTINERCLMGLILSRLYNSPFKGHVYTANEYIYCYLAPVITGFLVWLWDMVEKEKYDGILFASRDGYLIKKLYEIMQSKLKNYKTKTFYFYTSRAAASSAGLDTRERVIWLLDVYKNMNFTEILSERLNLSQEKIDKVDISHECITNPTDKLLGILLEQSSRLCGNYKKYIKTLDINEGRYAFFDFVSSGTCQVLLSSILDVKIEGAYFCKNYAGDSERQRLIINSFLQNNDIEKADTFFFSVYQFFEVFMTSCDPALLYFDNNGMPVFDREKRTEIQLNMIEHIHSVIIDFFKEYIDNLYVKKENIRPEIADNMLKMLQNCPEALDIFKSDKFILVDDWINHSISFGK